MIEMAQALKWLNEENPTRLRENALFWIERLASTGLPDIDRLDIIETLLRTAGRLTDGSEQAEVRVHCGVNYYYLLRYKEAREELEKARSLYRSLGDTHRLAVVDWMLYLVMRAEGRYRTAFDKGREARALFLEKSAQHAMKKSKKVKEYSEIIQGITEHLISSPEDTFEWLYEFRGSQLSPSAARVKERIADFIEKKNFQQADQEMKLLVALTPAAVNCEETGEVYAYRAVAEWIEDNYYNAVLYFRHALAQFKANSHEYAMTLWMLGLAQSYFPDQKPLMVISMQAAIDCMDQLRQQAIHDNHMDRRDFYALHHDAMQRFLDKKIAGTT